MSEEAMKFHKGKGKVVEIETFFFFPSDFYH